MLSFTSYGFDYRCFYKAGFLFSGGQIRVVTGINSYAHPGRGVPYPTTALGTYMPLVPVGWSTSLHTYTREGELSCELPTFEFYDPSQVSLSMELLVRGQAGNLLRPVC